MARQAVIFRSSIVLFAVLALAMPACGPLAASKPTVAATPASPFVPAATPLPPTSTIALPASTTTPVATVNLTASPVPTVTPTTEPTTLAPSVLAAVGSFRAEIPTDRAESPSQIERAQSALAAAAVALVSSGDAKSQQLRDQLSRALTPDQGAAATVASVDLDADGKADLIVSVPVAGLVPILLPAGEITVRPLLPASNMPGGVPIDTVTSVVDVRELSAAGKPDVVLTRISRGASALNTELMVVSWDGQQSTTLFDQTLTDWAGPATWQIAADGTIELTCPAFGVYDHKLLPHPQQTRSYRWNGSSIALVARYTDRPETRRQMMNLAEADFFAGDRGRATQRYQSVIDDAALRDDPGDTVDWVDFARFRLGELAALSGNQSEAERWLSAAAQAKPALGPVASEFLRATRASGAAAGFAAVQRSDLPTLFERGQMGNLDFPVALGPFGALGEGIASSLDQIGDPSHLQAAQLTTTLNGQGYRVENVVVADLDGDGTAEVAMVVPFGSRESTLWLFDRSTTHWRAVATVQAPGGLAGPEPLSGHRQAIRIVAATGSNPAEQLLIWNGSAAALATSPTADPMTVSLNFVSAPDNCVVAEDLGGP